MKTQLISGLIGMQLLYKMVVKNFYTSKGRGIVNKVQKTKRILNKIPFLVCYFKLFSIFKHLFSHALNQKVFETSEKAVHILRTSV